jgi:hypothetical protein
VIALVFGALGLVLWVFLLLGGGVAALALLADRLDRRAGR